MDSPVVENVRQELAAFHISDKGKNTENMNPSENTVSHQDVTNTNGSRSADNEQQPEPSRPSRIIKLSRPANPFPSRSSRNSQSDNSSSVNGSTNSSLSSTAPAMGSRLAALQRPGSPFSKYLQRAQSPAITAGSKITRSATVPGSTATSGRETANTTDVTQNDTGELANGISDNGHENEQLRTVLPPNSQTTTVTRSVLLRRPRSPFNTGQSQQLLNKQGHAPGPDESSPISPKSPLSDGLSSPSLPPRDASQVPDKAAIRNKLRANSFRLKDLLSSRPFVKSRQDGDPESKDDNSATQRLRLSESDRTQSVPEQPAVSAGRFENETSTHKPDRTRWRVEGSSLPIRPRSRISDRMPTTLISARSVSSRDRDKSHITGVEEGSVASKDVNNELSRQPECNSSANINSQINVPNVEANETMSNSFTSDPVAESHAPFVRGSVGATLLRSPRTRSTSASSVPSQHNPQSRHSSETAELDTEAMSNRNQTNGEEEVYQKSKAISDLDTENGVNLIFDSETMVQSASSTDESPVNYEPRMSQSMFADSNPASRQKPRMASEPATPITETHNMPNSKSFENSLDADFAKSSPGLKRSLAVTDLDQAMLDRDQQKLQSMFSREDSSSSGGKVESRLGSRDRHRSLSSSSQLETDIDGQQSAIHRSVRSPRIKQKMVQSLDDMHSPPQSSGVMGGSQPTYTPSVNLEDAVKWPMDVPGILDFRKMEVFEGQMLLNWLAGSIDKSHYLRLVMTRHDISVIACQICTCLVAAGVIKQLEGKDAETVFKADCMYYWTHSQASPSVQDVNRLPPMWPPTQTESHDNKPGLKYTEADHQTSMVELRHEYKEEVDKLQTEQRCVLDRARQEYERRLQDAVERIALLQKDVEKYKCLAGIEKLTQAALSDADAARVEAGLLEGHHLHSPDRCSSDYVGSPHSPREFFNDVSTPSELRPDQTEEVPVPPPPPPPPPGFSEGGGPPPPPPAPPPFGSAVQRRESLKPVISPRSPMKPLFWNRIQVHDVKTPRHKEYCDSHLIWEDVKEEDFNMSELDDLFSKSVAEPSRRFSPFKQKAKAKQVAKIIAPKRSQTIGILLSSLRMDMSYIEQAILLYDTSILNEEKLHQIYDNRGSGEEIKKIKDHLKKHPDIDLDKPDQFLYDLSLIPDYAERIFCFIFQQAFQESISVIESKMTNLRMTCQALLTSVHIKRILGLVLALGNYMNGGNRNRGQADGFGIDILPKLKDVKSKDNSSSLLHYTVIQYIRKFEKDDAGTDCVRLPLPDPSDMKQATQVHFDELEKELNRINKDFESAEQRADKVIKSAMMQSSLYLQPFKDTMTAFFEKGRHEFHEQEENLAEGKRLFAETVITFCMKPKHGEKVVTPEYFFSLWTTFCQDFKDMWKREQQKILKLRIKENELRLRKIQEGLAKKPVRTRTRQRGGLKDRLAKQGLLQS